MTAFYQSVVDEVDKELAALTKRGAHVGPLGALARRMAVEIDGDNSATSKSMCGRVLLDTLQRIAETVPEERAPDALDALDARMRARIESAKATASA